ncbi:MAG: RcnB family protein [Proteobacteria bacterium]|nr:RcnB family protein [Pseudomonadota bacterium]
MRKFLISAAIVSLIGSASLAIAQDRDHRGPERGNSQSGRNSIGQSQFREHHDAPSPQADTMRGINRAMNGNPGRPDAERRDNSIGQRDNRRDNNRPDFNRPGPDRRDVRRPDFRPDFNDRRGDRERRDFRDYRNYHQNFRASHHFRAPPYRRPPGYFVRRWSWGQTLPAAFWTRDYWLTDFYAYDLPPPPYGAIWVRVGDDALLIDQYTGEIIEVDYGVFF